jgi:hypothetical protein
MVGKNSPGLEIPSEPGAQLEQGIVKKREAVGSAKEVKFQSRSGRHDVGAGLGEAV